MTPDAGRPRGRDLGAGEMIHLGNGINNRLPAGRAHDPPTHHQLSLDDALALQPVARATDPVTSHQAGESAKANQGRLMRMVLATHAENPQGLTDDEVALRHPDQNPASVGRRRTTLRDLGYVEDTGERRLTRWNRSAVVWRITPTGFTALDREES